jgi:hypothetical protein
MIIKIMDAIRFVLAILVAISTMAIFFLSVKKDLKDKED